MVLDKRPSEGTVQADMALLRAFDINRTRALVQRVSGLVAGMLSLDGRLSHQPRFSSISTVLRDPKLNNTPLSTTFAPVNIEKCHKLSAITKTLSTPQTFSTAATPQIPSTTLPPTMSLKYSHGYLH